LAKNESKKRIVGGYLAAGVILYNFEQINSPVAISAYLISYFS